MLKICIASLITLFATPAMADLGEAEIPASMSGQIYNAVCGKDNEDCTLEFVEDRFKVDNGLGISATQLRKIKHEKVHTGDLLRTWHYNAYSFMYTSKNGEIREGSFRFYNDKINEKFKNDLTIWVRKYLSWEDISTDEYQANPEASENMPQTV